MQGVYWIINWLNLKRYIGSAKDIKGRWKGHLKRLRENRHGNQPMQNAWNKYVPIYGEEIFVLEVVEQVEGSREYAFDREQHYLDLWWGTGFLYNARKDAVGGSEGGYHHTEEAVRKKYGSNNAAKPYPAFFNPLTGKTIPAGRGLMEMCRARDLPYGVMRNIVKGYSCQTKSGWRLACRKDETFEYEKKRGASYPAFYNVRTGKIIPAGRSLTRMCNEQGLTGSNMSNLKRKVIKQTKDGWRLATESENET